MNITFQAVGFEAGEHLRELVNHKVARLFNQNGKITQVDVSMEKLKEGDTGSESCEISVSLPGDNVVVKKNKDVFEKSLNAAIDAVLKILRRAERK